MNETVAKNAKPFWQISQYLIVWALTKLTYYTYYGVMRLV
jgi:hypothetical protein